MWGGPHTEDRLEKIGQRKVSLPGGGKGTSMKIRSSIVVACLCLASIALLNGCGASAVSLDPEAVELLEKTQEKMSQQASYRVDGTSQSSVGKNKENVIDMKFTIEYEILKDATRVLTTLGADSEEPIEAYIIEGYIYSKTGDDKWIYTEYDPVTEMKSNMVNIYTDPESMGLIVEHADKISIAEEDDSSITLLIGLGESYYREILGRLKAYVEEKGLQEYEQELEELELVSSNLNIDLEFTIDRDNMLLTEMSAVGESHIPRYQGHQAFTMYMNAESTFSDYGKDFGIRLPEEAAGAIYKAPGGKND